MTRNRAYRFLWCNHVTLASWAAVLLGAGTPAAAQDASSNRPMWFLETFGSPGNEITPLLWGLLWLAIGVVVVIVVLIGVGLALRLRPGHAIHDDRASVGRRGSGGVLRWIYSGLALTALILVGYTVWTVNVLAAISNPDEEPRITIAVTGHQWWWDLEYSGEAGDSFKTANEIYIPVGEPVRLRFASADVIHSFWVPALGGKTDLIPGQTNTGWLEADAPGVYRGQCAEYCGLQHANMALRVVALPRKEFDSWWKSQTEAQPDLQESELMTRGQDAFMRNCSACHTVRGTLAQGAMGPDLTHVMSRSTLASGLVPNTKGHLAGWIANPEHLKPGTPMPNPDLPGEPFDALLEYVMTLE